MQSNIDRNGRIVRAVAGMFFLGIAVVLYLLPWPASPRMNWTLVGIATAVGLFQLYEAKKGWCIARACGIKTRI